MFALTFGSVDRFGVQTRQLYEFFKDRGKRYDRKETQLIVEDIQKYRTAQRIGAFVKEEEKVGVGERNVEADYDLRKVTDRGAGRISRVRVSESFAFDAVNAPSNHPCYWSRAPQLLIVPSGCDDRQEARFH